MSDAPYEIIIGLEVHVQLKTETKLFCGCPNRFGGEPNTQTCPVCIGLPGALPVMNRRAFQLALKTAIALNCRIPAFTKWDRKQYYYPDLPKGYQISQFDLPMSEQGFLTIRDSQAGFPEKPIRITRAHLEEDAGKSMHDELAGRADSRIDLNRAGTPLLEIVSEPDLRSPQEARAYLSELKLLLTYLDVSDCNMQEGSLRVDANVNLQLDSPRGRVATPIVEVKNMNSFRAVERALAYEVQRQYQVWCDHGVARGDAGGHKTTRGWDEQAQVTRAQRQKEESSDYRYFPDPDLAPVTVRPEQIEAIRQEMGELPAALRNRLQATYELALSDAEVIVNQGPAFAEYFEKLAELSGDPRRASNWMQQDVLRTLNEQNQTIAGFPIPATALAELLKKLETGTLDSSRARDVFQTMVDSRSTVTAAMQQLGIETVDHSELLDLCSRLLDENPAIVADVQAGKAKAVGALIGQAKRRNPNANPNQVRQICLQLIAQRTP